MNEDMERIISSRTRDLEVQLEVKDNKVKTLERKISMLLDKNSELEKLLNQKTDT